MESTGHANTPVNFSPDSTSTPTKGFPSFSIGSMVSCIQGNDSYTTPIVPTPHARAGAVASNPCEKSTRRVRKIFTSEEDAQLLMLVQREGIIDPSTGCCTSANFSVVARHLGTERTARQCRDRWKYHLRGGIKKGGWTSDEEELIKDLHVTFGSKWASMARVFKHRTENDIKNKWYSMKRTEERARGSASLKKKMTPVRQQKNHGSSKKARTIGPLPGTSQDKDFQTRDWASCRKPTAS